MAFGVGFDFTIKTTLQEIDSVEVPKALGIQDGMVVSFKQGLLEELPNRKLEQRTHRKLGSLNLTGKCDVARGMLVN
ncbi:MAG: hypothetical protein RLZZ511_51 [Cyanobacteriota bacterium]|jgi:hypothetical protein